MSEDQVLVSKVPVGGVAVRAPDHEKLAHALYTRKFQIHVHHVYYLFPIMIPIQIAPDTASGIHSMIRNLPKPAS